MANLFKGYAQKTDFSGNLLKGVDPSDRILEEGKRHLKQWKDVSQGEQENQQRYLAGLEAKFQAEEADRARNKKLEEYFADGWGQALDKRHSQLVKNAQDKATESQQLAKKLQGWSNKAAEIGVDAAKGYAKAKQEFGMNLAIDLGLSWEQAKSIQTVEDTLDATYKGTNDAVLEARKKGASWEQIEQIKKLSFLGNQGFRVGTAMRAGKDYHINAIIKWGGEEFETKYGMFSLHKATQQKNLGAFEVVKKKIRTKYINEVVANTGIKKELLVKYARDDFIRVEGRIKTTIIEGSTKQSQELAQRQAAQLTESKLKTSAEALQKHVQNDFGPNNENRAGALAAHNNTLVDLASTGRVTSSQIESWLTQPWKINGKEVEFQHQWPEKAEALREAVKTHVNKKNQDWLVMKRDKERELDEKAKALKKQLLINGEELSSGERASMIAEADKQYGEGNAISKVLIADNRDHVSEANDTIYEDELEKLKERGLVTPSYVKSLGLTPTNEAKWMKVAREQDPFQPSAKETKILEDLVDTKINDILKEFDEEAHKVSSSVLAKYTAKNTIKSYFIAAAKDPNLTRAQMIARALSEFEVDFAKDYQITEFRTVNGVKIRDPQFNKFAVSAERHPVAMSEITAEEVAANPRLPYEKLLFSSPVPVVKFWTDLSQGRDSGYPPEARHYVSKVGIGPNGEVKMTELMFMEAQMKLIEPEFEIPEEFKQMHKMGIEKIPVEWRKYIIGAHANVNSQAASIKYGAGLEHKDLQSSENYADQNQTPYANILRNPVNYHAYLNTELTHEMLMEDYYGRA
jgi:hypothetical protein